MDAGKWKDKRAVIRNEAVCGHCCLVCMGIREGWEVSRG